MVCKRSWVRVPVGPCAFSSPVTFGGSVWVRARAASSKGTVSSVPTLFQADSGTNLFKQGEIVAGRPCGSVVQLARVLARYARGPGFHTCHSSRREEKTHGIMAFLTASRRETKTSQKEQNPMLIFPQATNFVDSYCRNYFFAWFPVLQHEYCWALRKTDNKRLNGQVVRLTHYLRQLTIISRPS